MEPPIQRHQLNDPAHIGAEGTTETTVQDGGGAAGLDAYMRLPVEQYDRLDPDMIKPLGGANYALHVPRVQIFSEWVEPVVQVNVSTTDGPEGPTVVIRAVNWAIRGSPLVEDLGLNRRFSLEFATILGWTPAAAAAGTSNGNGSSVARVGTGTLRGRCNLDVYAEVIGPFRFMPRVVLQTGGNAVMSALVNALLPMFMKRLSADYERWAADPKYRAQRSPQTATASP